MQPISVPQVNVTWGEHRTTRAELDNKSKQEDVSHNSDPQNQQITRPKQKGVNQNSGSQ
jgi:hypothetical protein